MGIIRRKANTEYIVLQKAAKITGYASDYIGWLIRTGKVKGKRVYTQISWQLGKEELTKYCQKHKNLVSRDFYFLNKKYSEKKYLSLKEAAEISGYASDYIGWLIRTGKIKGKKVYTGISWQTTEEAIKNYQKRKTKTKGKIFFNFPSYIKSIHLIPESGNKVFGFGWRLSLTALIIFFLVSGFAPIKFLHNSLISAITAGETKTINYYPAVSSGDWQNPENVQALPEVGPTGDINSFNENNSAVYKSGPLHLVSENFTAGEDFTNYNFHSAKIKISFAIGEKKSDIQIIENQEIEPAPSDSQPTGLWNKVKNFFSILGNKISQIVESLEIKNFLVVKAEEGRVENGSLPAEETITAEATTTEPILEETITTEEATTTETTTTPEITERPTTEASLPDLDTRIIIWWSLDGQDWQQLVTISDYPLSNFLNGGYFEYEAPFLKDFEDVRNLKIKFEGVVGSETEILAYLDSVWVEIEYKEEKEEEEEEFELIAIKKDWRADETPEFEIIPKGKKEKENLIEKLIAQVSEIFEEEPKVEAKLANPQNQELELQEGEDFSAETHSPTKITIFRPEEFSPGRYNLKIEFEKNGKIHILEQDFTWGVLAINVNKSIYLPNEKTYLQMAALDEGGHTICDADLMLEITAPDGTKTTFKTEGQQPEITSTTSTLEEATSTEEILEEQPEATSTEATSTPATTTTEELPATSILQTENGSLQSETSTSEIQESESTPEITTSTISFWNKIKNPFAILEAKAADNSSVGVIERSPECGPNSITYTPDYYTYYNVGETGEYQIKLTAVTKNGSYEITDGFEVKESVPFDVERIGPTRIYPPATYEMTLKIKVNQDFVGEIIETVPASFEITLMDIVRQEDSSVENGSLRALNGKKEIVWRASWFTGEEYELRYQFKAPNISPYLYLLGPLRIGDFQETRQWQIAADQTGNIVPESPDITADWTPSSGTTHWNLIDEGTTPDTADFIYAGASKTDRFNMTTIAGVGTVTQIQVYLYAYSTKLQVVTVTLYWTGGNSSGQTVSPPLTSYNWVNTTFTSLSLSGTQLDSLSIGIVTGASGGRTTYVATLYAIVTYSAAAPTLNQRSVVWQNDDGTNVNNNTTSTTPDTSLTMEKGERATWRVQIDNTGTAATTTVYKMKWATTSTPGGCTSTLTWYDVTATSDIAFSYGLAGTNGENVTGTVTNISQSCGDGSCTGFATGTWHEAVATTSSHTLTNDWNTEFGFMIETSKAVASTTYCLRLIDNNTGQALDNYYKFGELFVTSTPTKRYSKNAVTPLPSTTTDLTYFLDNKGYNVVASSTDDKRDPITSSSNIPVFLFAKKHTNNTDMIVINWDGQSTAAPSAATATMEIWNGSSWESVDYNNSANANTDFPLSGNKIETNYYDASYWVYIRVYQAAGSQTLKTDYISISFVTPKLIGGVVYINEGQTEIGPNKKVRLKVNGEGNYLATTTATSSYSFPVVATTSDVITVFLDEEAEKAVTVTRATSTNINNLHLYQNRVIVRHEGEGPITITDLDKYDSGQDPDILFTASTSPNTLTVNKEAELYIWPEKTFAPGGDVTINPGGLGDEWDGSLKICSGSTFTASSTESHSIGGYWIASSTAIFTAASSTITFTATTTGKTITTAGNSFYKLTFNGSGGGWTFQDTATTTATTTISNGTLNQGANNFITRSFTIASNATFTKATGGGILIFEGSGEGYFEDSNTTKNNLGNVQIGNSPATTTLKSDFVADSLTVNSGDIFKTKGYEVDITNNITIHGTYDCTATGGEGNETLTTLGTIWTVDSGATFTAASSTTILNGASDSTLNPGGTDGDHDFYHLTFEKTSTATTTLATSTKVLGDLIIGSSSILDASSSNYNINVAGSWTNSGTFVAQQGTVTFDGSSAGKTIDSGGIGGNKAFYNIEFNNVSGGWTFSTSTTIANNCTTTAGAVTSTSGILYIGGNWYVASSTGIFHHNNGEVIFYATSTGRTITDGGWPFHLLTFNGDGGEWLYQDSTSTSPATTTVVVGTPTFLNAKTGNVLVTGAGGILNVDWYLGVHIVDKDYPDYDIDTDDNDITISEATASSTVWKWDGSNWLGPYNSTITGSLSDGKIPHPATTTAGAVRIREYSKTAATTTFYKYNLTITSQDGFDPYNYSTDYRNGKYIISTSYTGGDEDDCISQNWHRSDISAMNEPYPTVNDKPTNGSWYIGMSSVLEFTVTPGEVELILNLDNYFTTTTSITLSATTSHPNGFIVKTHMEDTQGELTTLDTEKIERFPHNNDSPGAWDDICNASSTQCGFGYTTNDNTLGITDPARFTDPNFCGATGDYCWAGFATSSQSTDPVATGGTGSYLITLKTSVNFIQLPDSYSGTIVFICTVNY